jgi:hypothetical protein
MKFDLSQRIEPDLQVRIYEPYINLSSRVFAIIFYNNFLFNYVIPTGLLGLDDEQNKIATDLYQGESMPVFSYLAYPKQGVKNELLNDLTALDYCEATPADNENILILITDTPDEETETALQKKLKELKTLESLGMTFGHVD